MTSVEAPNGAIDVCGTGGGWRRHAQRLDRDSIRGGGLPESLSPKHGNRAMSSRTGAADVLELLGVPIDLNAEPQAAHLSGFRECRFCVAPAYHPAMKNVGAGCAASSASATVFQFAGPDLQSRPRPPSADRHFCAGVARTRGACLGRSRTEKAWIVHGADGLDELTTTGVTHVAVLEKGAVSLRDITPEDAGLKRVQRSALKG